MVQTNLNHLINLTRLKDLKDLADQFGGGMADNIRQCSYEPTGSELKRRLIDWMSSILGPKNEEIVLRRIQPKNRK
jgi:hypothetical protein